QFWQENKEKLPKPGLIAIATLPIPSLENPLVAGLVTYYKQKRKDWFRLYLLPTALRELQRAIAPVRTSEGILAILDNRVNLRSYGKDILSVLSPFARINYIDGF
ncbi:MAG TPA: helicase C-terminal domain-containing protein, partial [Allocoleopsis sp.]